MIDLHCSLLGALQNGSYPGSYRRVSDESNSYSRVADKTRSPVEDRPASDPASSKDTCDFGSEIRKHYSVDSFVPERTEALNLKRPKKSDKEKAIKLSDSEKYREEKGRKVPDERSAVAASAMLQLSSGEDKTGCRSREHSRDYSGKSRDACSRASSFPKIVPLKSDGDGHEWLFRDRQFILKSSSTRDLIVVRLS